MPISRAGVWLTLILAAAGLLLVAVPGLWLYMKATATPIHPDPRGVPSAAHSSPPPEWSGAVEQGRRIVREALTAQNLPGLSVAVGIGNGVVWAEGFGFADLEGRVPLTPDHRFRIGTASIVLTSAAAGLLLEQGRMKLDDPIQTHVPAFPKKQWPVTLRQLMGHLAGLVNDAGDEGPLFSEHCERPVEALPHFAARPLRFEPGTAYRHSSYGWILVSAAIEAAAGQPFLAFMQDRIFAPLEMSDTLPESANRPVPAQAASYFPRFAADPKYGLHPMRDLDYSCYAGASVFLSTPSDLVRFAMAVNGGKLLQPSTVQLLQTAQRLASGEQTGYGLGWDLETVELNGRQTRAVGHDGETLGGMVASLIAFPDRGMAVSVTSNISYADTSAIAVSIAQAFAAQAASPPRQ